MTKDSFLDKSGTRFSIVYVQYRIGIYNGRWLGKGIHPIETMVRQLTSTSLSLQTKRLSDSTNSF